MWHERKENHGMKLERRLWWKTQIKKKRFLETPHRSGVIAEGERGGGHNFVPMKVLIYFRSMSINVI